MSLGRTKSATKLVKGVARAWTTYKPRLPLTVRGVRIELREGEGLPDWALKAPQTETRGPPKIAKATMAVSDLEEKGKSVSRGLVIALAARLAFVVLPALPVRVKNVSFAHKVLICTCKLVLTDLIAAYLKQRHKAHILGRSRNLGHELLFVLINSAHSCRNVSVLLLASPQSIKR